MTQPAAERALPLLRDSLALWRVDATLDAGQAPVVAVIRTPAGACVHVEAAAPGDAPVRWWVRWREGGGPEGAPARARPCASAVGLLRTVRESLGADGGMRLAIAPDAGTRG